MKTLIAILVLVVMAGTAGAQIINSNNPKDVPEINGYQNARISELEKQSRSRWITTEGGVRIRQDRITGCRVTEHHDVWGFKDGDSQTWPGSVLVGHKTEAYYAGEWWTIKRYLVPESQWHRYDQNGQRMKPEQKAVMRTKQRASALAGRICR